MGKSILFFGELPPSSINGISISNQINIDILKSKYNVITVKEFSDLRFHEQGSFSKALSFLNSYLEFLKSLFKMHYDFFYGVIYLSTYGMIKNLSIVCLFRLFNPKSIIILHFHRSDFEKFLSKKINRFLFHILDRLIAKYILLSNSQREQISLPDHKKFVLYNTIEEQYIEQQHIPRNNNNLSIIYIGNYIKEKGIFDLFDAIKKYNLQNLINVKLQCYGNTSTDETRDALDTYIDENIQINGPVSGEQKFQLLRNADLIILPSYNEGMPLILLESMAIGLPVIISKIGFIEEGLGSNYSLYCQPSNIQSVIDAITLFLTLDRSDLSHQLKHKYLKFSMNEHKVKLLDIFNE